MRRNWGLKRELRERANESRDPGEGVVARNSVHVGMDVGAAVGIAAGLTMGAVFGWDDPAGAVVGAVTLGILLGCAGLLGGCLIVTAGNFLVELTTPHAVPSSGPEADYHDLHEYRPQSGPSS
jgi:hypothetical protein